MTNSLTHRNQRGFASLVLMLVVCAIVLTLSALALPNVARIRQIQNERDAAAQARAIAQAEGYAVSLYDAGYQRLDHLVGTPGGIRTCYDARLLPAIFTHNPNGYVMTFTLDGEELDTYDHCDHSPHFKLTLSPRSMLDAQRSYFVDETGVLRFNDTGPADNTSTPLN